MLSRSLAWLEELKVGLFILPFLRTAEFEFNLSIKLGTGKKKGKGAKKK